MGCSTGKTDNSTTYIEALKNRTHRILAIKMAVQFRLKQRSKQIAQLIYLLFSIFRVAPKKFGWTIA